MNKKFFIFYAIMVIFLTGCQKETTLTQKPKFNTSQTISKAQEVIDQNTISIKNSSDNIKEEINIIDEASLLVPDDSKAIIQSSSDKILDQISIIENSTNNIYAVKDSLENIKNEVDIMDSSLTNIEKERNSALKAQAEAERQKNESLFKMLRWLIAGCIVGVAVFGISFLMYGSKIGIIGASSCAVILSISIFVQSYFAYLAIIGGIILLGLMGLLIWNILVHKRAFEEVVSTVEVAQDNMSEVVRTKLFGGKGETGIMNNIQSKETMDLVKVQKQKMSKLWNYAKDNKISKIANSIKDIV
jgi:hypothetical protein